MGNKIAAALLLSLWFAMPAWGELLKLSLLEKNVSSFSLKLDIFNGDPSAGPPRQEGQPTPQTSPAVEQQKTIAEEIFQSVSYEGYVSKSGKSSALLSISGEFFMVNEGDWVLQKIKILKIGRATVTIEYENLPYDIKLKGDENG